MLYFLTSNLRCHLDNKECHHLLQLSDEFSKVNSAFCLLSLCAADIGAQQVTSNIFVNTLYMWAHLSRAGRSAIMCRRGAVQCSAVLYSAVLHWAMRLQHAPGSWCEMDLKPSFCLIPNYCKFSWKTAGRARLCHSFVIVQQKYVIHMCCCCQSELTTTLPLLAGPLVIARGLCHLEARCPDDNPSPVCQVGLEAIFWHLRGPRSGSAD